MPKAPKKSKPTTSHARLAPSTFKGYELCPSYQSSSESTKASERGAELHDLLEKHGADVTEHADRDEVDTAHLELIADYLRPFELDAKQRKFKVLKEHKFDLRSLKIDGCDGGTGDLLILNKKQAHADLFDYKMGWWEVDDAEVNIQIGIYVLGVFFEFPWVESVMAHILQPARDEVGTHTFTRADVPRILLRAKTIADRVNKQAGKMFNPVADNCLWCNNKANCLALHEFALRVNKSARLHLPSVNLKPDEFNDPKHAGDVYDVADILAKWAGAVKHKITTLALDGHDIDGHTIREVSGKRVIIDPEGTQELLEEKFEVTRSEFYTACNPSVTKLMKLVSGHAERGDKAKSEKAASDALMGEGVITQNSPSAYLIRIKTKEKEDTDG